MFEKYKEMNKEKVCKGGGERVFVHFFTSPLVHVVKRISALYGTLMETL